MKKMKLTRYLRPVIAVLITLAMLLCCGCGKQPEETTNPNALGDGDGKLEAQDFVDGFTTVYGAMLSAMGGQTDASSRSEVDISVTLGDDLVSSLGYMLEAYELPGDAAWLKEFGMGMDMNYTNDLTKMVLALRLGDTELASAEIIQDVASQMIYAALPGLNDQYLAMDESASEGAASAGMMSQMKDYAALVSALPTEDALHTLLTRYLNLVLEQLEEPAVSTEKLSCNGISQDVTATTHTIRRSDVLDMAEAVMKAAQTDAELEKMLDDLAEYYNAQMEAQYAAYSELYGTTLVWEAVDIHQNMMDEIESALEDIAETRVELEDSDFLRLSVFEDGKEQLGLRLQIEDDADTIAISAYSLRQDENTAVLLEVKDAFCFTGSGTEKDGLANGKYTLSVEGSEMAQVEVRNMDMKALKKGEMKGTLVLSLSEEMIEEIFGYDAFVTPDTTLAITFNTTQAGGNTNIELYNGSVFMLRIMLRTKELPAENIQIPTNVVKMETEEDLLGWASAIDFAKLLQNLRQAGAPAEVLDLLEANLPATN